MVATESRARGPSLAAEGGGFAPILARTTAVHRPITPAAFDCVRFVFVRHGSALVLSTFGEKPVAIGDVIALGANTLCWIEPEDSATLTTLYVDRDYIIDQVFWQYARDLTDRLDAQDFMDELYVDPAQILRLGEHRAGMLMPWLDEMGVLSIDGHIHQRFYRMQALLSAVIDVLVPHVKTSPIRQPSPQRRKAHPGTPRHREFSPLRPEARRAAELMREATQERWTLDLLAEAVHLSGSQLSRVFVEAYGKTPLSYLTMLRAERLARLLRETDLAIEVAMNQVGWSSRGHAARLFRQCVGVTPNRYETSPNAPSGEPDRGMFDSDIGTCAYVRSRTRARAGSPVGTRRVRRCA